MDNTIIVCTLQIITDHKGNRKISQGQQKNLSGFQEVKEDLETVAHGEGESNSQLYFRPKIYPESKN